VASASFSRCEQARFCAVAQAGKAVGDFGKSQIDVPFDVFGKDGSGPDFADDPLDLRPKVTRVGFAATLAGIAEGLTRITGREDMNAIAPCSAVEGSKVAPDKRMIQGRVFHPGHESRRSVGFPLDETNSSVAGLGDGKAKVETAVTGAQGEAVKPIAVGMKSHKCRLRGQLIGRSEKGSLSGQEQASTD